MPRGIGNETLAAPVRLGHLIVVARRKRAMAAMFARYRIWGTQHPWRQLALGVVPIGLLAALIPSRERVSRPRGPPGQPFRQSGSCACQ